MKRGYEAHWYNGCGGLAGPSRNLLITACNVIFNGGIGQAAASILANDEAISKCK